jgi:nascent polypeptide-associated complex subunit alpha
MPNIDPRTMKNMMAKMGIKSDEINADKVVIETPERDIVIDNPQVTRIEMQGSVSFQVSGSVTEVGKKADVEVPESDIDFVMEKTGIEDRGRVLEALEKAEGDIAKAILDLTGNPAT